jgi:hypothetical protein
MKLFCFASRSVDNIWRGVTAKKWAVATVSDSAMRGRITKAQRYFVPGAHGVLYCNPTQSFTTPFIATSEADPTAVVTDIWPEAWSLPFSMQPLGDPRRQLHVREAASRWSIHVERLRDYKSVTAALNITGATVFVPTEISEAAWRLIMDDLAIGPDYADSMNRQDGRSEGGCPPVP